jgi:nitrogen PTS system EIIA component
VTKHKGTEDIDLSGMIAEERIIDLWGTSKLAVIEELVEVMSNAPAMTNREAFRRAVLDREAVMSTGIGLGVAIPHARIPEVKDFVIAVGRSEHPITFDSFDGGPVFIVIMIAANTSQQEEYLQVVAKLVRVLRDSKNRRKLLEAENPETVREILLGKG